MSEPKELEADLEVLRDWVRGASREDLVDALVRMAANAVKQVLAERERCAKIAAAWAGSYDADTEIEARIRSGE